MFTYATWPSSPSCNIAFLRALFQEFRFTGQKYFTVEHGESKSDGASPMGHDRVD